MSQGFHGIGPLGCRIALPPVQVAALRTLECFDLRSAREIGVSRYKWTAELAAFVERETKRFLSICYLVPEIEHSPCLSVDEFWHILLEDSAQYSRLCAPLGGRIGHVPDGDASPVGEHDPGARTRAEYRRLFGRVPRLWSIAHVVSNNEVADTNPAFIIKLTNVCNLDCTYCYMFQSAGATYKRLPAMMSRETAAQSMHRIGVFCSTNGIRQPCIVLHGGEPLLVGEEYIDDLLASATEAFRGIGLDARFAVQTNAVLLDENWAAIFEKYGVSVGISIDGPSSVNDAHRIDHKGAGSYERVVAGIRKSGLSVDRFGAIAVVKPNADGEAVFRHLLGLGFKSISFLLGDATHDSRPPDIDGCIRYLSSVFDAYWALDDSSVTVDPFDGIIKSILGGSPNSDALGLGPVAHVVIESDGAIAPLDSLRVCGADVYRSVGNVCTDAIDIVLSDSLYMRGVWKDAALSRQCLQCEVGGVCGGGYLPHRHSRSSGFNNPSVYCEVLLGIIQRVRSAVAAVEHRAVSDRYAGQQGHAAGRPQAAGG